MSAVPPGANPPAAGPMIPAEQASTRPLPPDQAIRDRIREDLERTLLVEAGAGSGKTTSLVDRMVALVRGDVCKVEQIAAVTFTRKAAAELRQRFQLQLEKELAKLSPEDPGRTVLDEAIRGIDGAFLGTIHAFCAKLLRERPLEAGLDPGFREVQESDAYAMQRAFWLDFLERLGTDGDPDLVEVERLEVEPERLQNIFEVLVEHPDVDFGFQPAPPPDPKEIHAVRERLDELLDRAAEMMKDREPEGGWDDFGKRIRTLLYWRRALDWSDRGIFFEALARLHRKKGKVTQKRWADTPAGKAVAKRLGQSVEEFAGSGSRADRLLRSWWAYRYPVAIRVARRAAEAFARQRKDSGELNFQDLLVLTAELLRRDRGARRDLGKRYPRILVDEFQDTDPLQAEILLLLASDPASGDNWHEVVPRPGALFVVGDPKQSIYRFRRADIALYDFVKRRFHVFGDVLKLDANFRSLGAVETLVEAVFNNAQCFPAEDSERQAAFAPLRTQRPRHGERGGPGLLATYMVHGKKQSEAAEDDAERIATEIARRTEAGERLPGDFMVLTRNRKFLSVYARSLEDRNIPVDVSGAGVGFEDELAALLLLFRCLADPEHQVRVVGVLLGPLFGITLDRLVAYRDADGRFRINRPPQSEGVGDGAVTEALGLLHRWWKRALREPADVTAERLVAETGLFPLAAAGKLGELRAGGLAYLLDAVRARALAGDTSIAGAVDALETALNWEDAETPLVPERPNCVQVLNLHRAKGLEANVVFLAAPFGDRDWRPSMRVSRDESGMAWGTIPIGVKGRYKTDVIAQPLSWEEDERVEAAFEQAEKVRLLYVAATRARDELWIARSPGGRGMKSPWEPLESWISAEAARGLEAGKAGFARLVGLPRGGPPPPDVLDPDTDLTVPIAAAARAAERAGEPTYRLDTVTARAKGRAGQPGGGAEPNSPATPPRALHADDFTRPPIHPASGGFEWGSVVHAVLAVAGEGTRGEALARLARELLVEYERPVDATGAPTELESLLALVEAVRGSELWERAAASRERHGEIPFVVNRGVPDGPPELIEGVIDLVFKDGDRWVVADYKTDSGDDPDFGDRVGQYRAQVDLYAECWQHLTGEEVGERVLVFTSQGRTESW